MNDESSSRTSNFGHTWFGPVTDSVAHSRMGAGLLMSKPTTIERGHKEVYLNT